MEGYPGSPMVICGHGWQYLWSESCSGSSASPPACAGANMADVLRLQLPQQIRLASKAAATICSGADPGGHSHGGGELMTTEGPDYTGSLMDTDADDLTAELGNESTLPAPPPAAAATGLKQ